MRGLGQLTALHLKLFFRDPTTALFTIGLPLILLFFFGSAYGNGPVDAFGGVGAVDYMLPGYIGFVISTAGLLTLVSTLALDRENGILRRLRATPVSPIAILGALVINQTIVTSLGLMALLVVSWSAFGASQGRLLDLTLAYLISGIAIYTLAFLVASALPTARSSQRVAMLIYFPMLFLSGAAMNTNTLTGGMKAVSEALPLTYAIRLMRGVWIGDGWGAHIDDLAFLGVFIVIGAMVAARAFRWE